MKNIVDRQTFIFSFNFFVNESSQILTQLNLLFPADELVVKNISYAPFSLDPLAQVDVPTVVQIWCNVTNDNLIGTFSTGTSNSTVHNNQFALSNTFQNGQFILQFQRTNNPSPFYYYPQALISPQAPQKIFGTVSVIIEFLKHEK